MIDVTYILTALNSTRAIFFKSTGSNKVISKIISVIIIGIFVVHPGLSQNKLAVKSFADHDNILLRWAPANIKIFTEASKKGFKLTRIDEQGTEKVVASQIKPIPLSDSVFWNKLLNSNKTSALALSLLSGPTNTSAESIYGLMLLGCDLDTTLARGCGLYFEDKNIDVNRKYKYKLQIIDSKSVSDIIIDASYKSLVPTPATPIAKSQGSQVKLRWSIIKFKSDFVGYDIERSVDSLKYYKINKAPVILLSTSFEKNKEEITFYDTVPETGIKYFYRIKGRNHFNMTSSPSNPIAVYVMEYPKSILEIKSIHYNESGGVGMDWSLSDENESKLISEIRIERSSKVKGPWNDISGSLLTYHFTDSFPSTTNYYRAKAFLPNGDSLISASKLLILPDSTPPGVPHELKGVCDSNGVVQLSWNKSKDNDLLGFKLFRRNYQNEEFIQLNKNYILNTFYADTINLNTLSTYVEYAIAASDSNHNTSPLSTPLRVNRPDKIPPVASVLRSAVVNQQGISINWVHASDSMAKNKLFRIIDNQQTPLIEWNGSDSITHFLDTTAISSANAHYYIETRDISGNPSRSNTVSITYYRSIREGVKEIKYFVDRAQKFIQLSWNYDKTDLEKYIIYRKQNDGPIIIVATLNSATTVFKDQKLPISNIFTYYVKPIFKDGSEGLISKAIKVEY